MPVKLPPASGATEPCDGTSPLCRRAAAQVGEGVVTGADMTGKPPARSGSPGRWQGVAAWQISFLQQSCRAFYSDERKRFKKDRKVMEVLEGLYSDVLLRAGPAPRSHQVAQGFVR